MKIFELLALIAVSIFVAVGIGSAIYIDYYFFAFKNYKHK